MFKQFKLFIIILLISGLGLSGILYAQTKSDSKEKSYEESKLTNDETEKQADKRGVRVGAGEEKVIDLDFQPHPEESKAVRIANEQVVKVVRVSQRDQNRWQLIFLGLKDGDTTVSIRDPEGNLRLILDVEVAEKDLVKMANELKTLLRDIEGIQIKILGRKIVIDGEVLVPSDYGRLLNVILDKAYADSVLNLTVLSGISVQVLSKRIQKDIQAFAPNVTTRVVNGQIWLEGTVDDAFQAKRAERLANLYLPDLKPSDPLEKDLGVKRLPLRGLIQNFLIINPPPPKKQDKLVRISIHFVELDKNYERVFGFKWQPGFTSDPQISIGTNTQGAQGAAAPASFTATISSLFPKLVTAQKARYARILNSGNVVVRSGRRADLVDRRKIPFPVVGPNGQVSAGQAEAGLSVAVTPLILGQSDDIEMDIDINQTNVVGQVGDQPITNDNAVKTKIYVKSQESAAIGGINTSDVNTRFNDDDPNNTSFGDPTTNPLFSLLRSKNYLNKRKQFVIFITPQIIENASQGTEDLKKNFRVKVK